MDNITQILTDATGPDQKLRAEAEAKLQAAEQADLPRFLVVLASELQNPTKPGGARTLAGIILKNALSSKDPLKQSMLSSAWLRIDPNLRLQVKQLCLATLSSEAREVRTTAAQVVSKIALIELPVKQWTELVETLLTNVTTSTNTFIKQASLETVGYVCEDIDEKSLADQSNKILTAVVHGMSAPEEDVKCAAAAALCNALGFAKANFQNEHERNYLMKVICESCTSASVKVRHTAFECLVKIAGLYYDKLAPYMQSIFQLTLEVIRKDVEEVALQAVEFWSTVCEEEIDILEDIEESLSHQHAPETVCHNFIKGALKYLVSVLTEALTKQKEDDDEDAWNLPMAAGTCLGLVAQATKDDILPEIIPFIEQNISSADWRLREAATLAFGSILDGPKTVQQLVVQAFGLLLKHMSDPVPQVKDTATWTVGRVCELHPRTLDDKLPIVFQALVEKLMDVPSVAANACWAIHNLAESFEEQAELQTSPIAPFFEGTVQMLLQTTERADASERKLRSSAYEAINLMIQAAPLDRKPLLSMLIPVFIDRLEQTYKMPVLNADDRDEQTEKQALLCGSLQTVIQKLGEGVKPKADDLMTAFLKVFNFKTASVHEEALMAVGALANAVDLDFEKYMSHFCRPLLMGLQNSEEHMVCAIAVGVVGDVCRALGDRVSPYCDQIIQVLLQNLQNPMLHRNVKPPILSCFGDIALAIGGHFEKYLVPVMSILQQASATQVDPNDYDLVEYLNLLRDGILEAYTGIFQGFRSDKKAHLLERYVEPILQFIEVVHKDENTSEQVLKGLVGLIGDIAHALGASARPVLQRPAISTLLSTSLKSEIPQIRDLAKWAATVINNPGA